MAKLKCVAHAERVMVLTDSLTVHRNDGSKCFSVEVWIGDRFFFASPNFMKVMRNDESSRDVLRATWMRGTHEVLKRKKHR